MEKQQNRSICHLGCGLGWAEWSTSSVIFTKWRQSALIGGHTGATWWIRLNCPSAVAMQSYVKLLWPLVSLLWLHWQLVCINSVLILNAGWYYFLSWLNFHLKYFDFLWSYTPTSLLCCIVTVLCYQARHGASGDSCNAKDGNPFGPFWDTFDIDFDHSEFYGPLGFDASNQLVAKKWHERLAVCSVYLHKTRLWDVWSFFLSFFICVCCQDSQEVVGGLTWNLKRCWPLYNKQSAKFKRRPQNLGLLTLY